MVLLNRYEVERTVSDMWTKLSALPEDEPSREDAVAEAIKTQERLYQTLARQERALNNLLSVCENVNPVDPLLVVDIIAANERGIRTMVAFGNVPAQADQVSKILAGPAANDYRAHPMGTL